MRDVKRCQWRSLSMTFHTLWLLTRRRAVLGAVFIVSLLVLGIQFTSYPIRMKTTVVVSSLVQRWTLTSSSSSERCRWNVTEGQRWSALSSLLHLTSNSTSSDGRQRRMFVTLPGASARLGNQMFGHAAMLGIAYCTGYRPVVSQSSPTSRLVLSTFAVRTDVVTRALSSSSRWQEHHVSIFTAPENMSKSHDDVKSAADADVELVGYFQSWRYFADVPDLVMSDFRFKPRIAEAASHVLDRLLKSLNDENSTSDATTAANSSRPILVGIHVRRSDMALLHHLKRGYTVADQTYFRHAMDYMEEHIVKLPEDRIVYVVCTDEPAWSESNIRSERFPVVFGSAQYSDSTVDLAVLASCDHVIISTGTYSWWAGYLATMERRRRGSSDGIVVYYAGFPPPHSEIGSGFRPSDVYPPDWIAMT